MTLFAVFAILLVATVAAFLLPPLWLGLPPAAAGANRRAANLAIFRDQLAELEREKAEDTLTAADFDQARRELQRRLLEEVEADSQDAGSRRPSRQMAIVLLVMLPLLAVGGYAFLGEPRALDPNLTAPRPEITADEMVDKLAERLKANPEDMQGWIMLARSYKALGRYAEAAEAYGKAESVVSRDAGLLADYAEALGMGSPNGLRGKPRDLVDQALKLDGNNSHALLLAGAAAMQAGNRGEALKHWEKLLPLLEPGSEMEALLKDSVAKLKQSK